MYMPEKPAPITTASKFCVALAICSSNQSWTTDEIDPRSPEADQASYPSPERSEPARLIAMLAGYNDAVKNNAGQGWLVPHALGAAPQAGACDSILST